MQLSEALDIAKELLNDLQEDLLYGVIAPEDEIQVLAEEDVIIDYYYDDKATREDLLRGREADETDKEFQQRQKAWEQYKKDLPHLKTLNVCMVTGALEAFVEHYSRR